MVDDWDYARLMTYYTRRGNALGCVLGVLAVAALAGYALLAASNPTAAGFCLGAAALLLLVGSVVLTVPDRWGRALTALATTVTFTPAHSYGEHVLYRPSSEVDSAVL